MSARTILTDARVEALFVSDLSAGAPVDRRQCDAAIQAAVRRYGVRGCLERLASEYGEHPEIAVARSRWARQLVEEFYGGSGARASRLAGGGRGAMRRGGLLAVG